MSAEQRRVIAAESKQLLENKHFREAWTAVEGYLIDQAHACDPDNKDKAQRIVIAMQLLKAVKREIERKVEDGDIAEIEIDELNRRKSLLRFVR